MNRQQRRVSAKTSPKDWRVVAWLNAPSPMKSALGRPEKPGPVPAEVGMTNLQVLAVLMAKNGFIANPQTCNQFSGPFGLTAPEYRLLLEMSTYLQGLIDGAGLDSVKTIGKYLEPELNLLVREFELQSEAEPAADPAALVEGGTAASESVETAHAAAAEASA